MSDKIPTIEQLQVEVEKATVYSDDIMADLLAQGALPQSICMAAMMLACRAAMYGMPDKDMAFHIKMLTDGIGVSYNQVKASLG